MRRTMNCNVQPHTIDVLKSYSDTSTYDLLADGHKLQRGLSLNFEYDLDNTSVSNYNYVERSDKFNNETIDISLLVRSDKYHELKNHLLTSNKLEIGIDGKKYFTDGLFYKFFREVKHNKNVMLLELVFVQKSLFYTQSSITSESQDYSYGLFDVSRYEVDNYYQFIDDQTINYISGFNSVVALDVTGVINSVSDDYEIHIGDNDVLVAWYIKITSVDNIAYIYPRDILDVGATFEYINKPEHKDILIDNISTMTKINIDNDIFPILKGDVTIETKGLGNVNVTYQLLDRVI